MLGSQENELRECWILDLKGFGLLGAIAIVGEILSD